MPTQAVPSTAMMTPHDSHSTALVSTPQRTSRGLVAGGVAMLAAVSMLAACGSEPKPQSLAAPSSPPVSPSASPSVSTAVVSAPATGTTPTPSKLGTLQTVLGDNVEATVTAFAYRQPTAKTAPKPSAPDSEWASADVQVCIKVATGDMPYVNNSSWLLIYADGTSAEPSNLIYNQFDSPGYPSGDRDLPAGRCIRGWITFVAPKGKRATMVEYQRRNGAVYDWAVS